MHSFIKRVQRENHEPWAGSAEPLGGLESCAQMHGSALNKGWKRESQVSPNVHPLLFPDLQRCTQATSHARGYCLSKKARSLLAASSPAMPSPPQILQVPEKLSI